MKNDTSTLLTADEIMSIQTISGMSPYNLARLVATLIRHEVKTGGPYIFPDYLHNDALSEHVNNLRAEIKSNREASVPQ